MLTLIIACTSAGTDTEDTGKTDTADTQDTDSGGTTDTEETGTTEPIEALILRVGEAEADLESYNGTEELALVGDGGDGDDLCRIQYSLVGSGPRTDCADCLWAHDMTIVDAAFVTVDLCLTDFDPALLDGTTRSYGYIPEYFGHAQVIAEDVGGEWTVTSFAVWDEETSAFNYEIEDGMVIL